MYNVYTYVHNYLPTCVHTCTYIRTYQLFKVNFLDDESVVIELPSPL